MIRRDFLRSLVTTAAGLLIAEDALELLLEPRRKLWAGHTFTLDGEVWEMESYTSTYYQFFSTRRQRHGLITGMT